MLNFLALVALFIVILVIAAVIVILGMLPGKIAVKRNHPHPDAVNAASWIGLATGVFWPVAFIWAFLPIPRSGTAGTANTGELEELKQRLATLESSQTSSSGDAA